MKVVFVYPNVLHMKAISLGIGYLMACLKREGHEVALVDGTYEKDGRVLTDRVIEKQGDMVAFSVTTPDVRFSLTMARAIKHKMKSPIVFGGPHPTACPEETLDEEGVDMVCVGEGEEAMAELAERMEAGQDISSTANFWLKMGTSFIRNEVRPLVADLDSLPFPERKPFEVASSKEGFDELQIISGRGCPHRCSYCINAYLQDVYRGKGPYMRKRSVENILEEISSAKENLGALKIVTFQDDLFLSSDGFAREFCTQYKQKYGLPFTCLSRPETITRYRCELLKEAGCQLVGIGIESGSERLRKEVLNRSISDEQIVTAFSLLREAGIKSYAYNIVGIPYETPEEMWKTVRLNQRIRPDNIHSSLLTPYPGTAIYRLVKEKGLLEEGREPYSLQFGSVIHYGDITPRRINLWKALFRYRVFRHYRFKLSILYLIFDCSSWFLSKVRHKIPYSVERWFRMQTRK